VITNRREPRSYLCRVFNSKLGCFSTPCSKCMVCMQPLLKLKTRPKACPVSYSLSMVGCWYRIYKYWCALNPIKLFWRKLCRFLRFCIIYMIWLNNIWDLEILLTRNVRKMDRFRSKLVSQSQTHKLCQTHKSTTKSLHYGPVCFIVQAQNLH